jgi:hypothetical protein
MSSPGNSARCGWSCKSGLPARKLPPQMGTVGSLPRPRKLRTASAVIARCGLIGVDNFAALNGKDDLQTPIADLYTLLAFGNPESARLFPGGHMGQTQTFPTMVSGLKNQLA